MLAYPSLYGRLETQHHAIENILATIPAGRFSTRPEPGKWNIHDNIAHLVRYQSVFMDRVNRILQEDQPSFNRYNAEEDPFFEATRMMDVSALIDQLRRDRVAIHVLVTDLTGIQVNRIGLHQKFGRLNILEWTEFFLLHEAHHIFTIFKLGHDTALTTLKVDADAP